ncbi:WGR domain-containing protein [Marivita sp. XM-24bin2]|uniref:WGR domain-containing protein n=1 Tax=unclassified Marivita TaxID=2632480 RepID=UPI000D7A8EF3|nr:WGR domain-containing protein [Marivita sp. XM-24bin2]MCR9110074.1 WGR domain-containing protein [Paracoccaceae bacterium]PWL33233.1 MAG: polymerase [Marivita sp. XM-24bin2]
MDLTRTEPEGAVQHFYSMELMPGLFGDWSLVREWGRVGQPGQIRIDWFDEEVQAKNARFAIQMEKAK